MTLSTILKWSTPSAGLTARPAVVVYADQWSVDAELDKCDDEPSLGALEGHTDQSRWEQSNRSDREADGSESGIGDHEGLVEQVGQEDWQPVFFV
jgi:hypothetical protein